MGVSSSSEMSAHGARPLLIGKGRCDELPPHQASGSGVESCIMEPDWEPEAMGPGEEATEAMGSGHG